MKKKLFGGICVLFLMSAVFLSCSSKGECVISYDCDTGTSKYEGSSTVLEVSESDCEDLAEDYKKDGECDVSIDWKE